MQILVQLIKWTPLTHKFVRPGCVNSNYLRINFNLRERERYIQAHIAHSMWQILLEGHCGLLHIKVTMKRLVCKYSTHYEYFVILIRCMCKFKIEFKNNWMQKKNSKIQKFRGKTDIITHLSQTIKCIAEKNDSQHFNIGRKRCRCFYHICI